MISNFNGILYRCLDHMIPTLKGMCYGRYYKNENGMAGSNGMYNDNAMCRVYFGGYG